MSDSGRPSEREIERGLRDLGARIEYPPTPDVAPSVRRRLEEEGRRGSPRRSLWRFVLSPRWSVPAAALVLLALALLTPTVRETLSEPFSLGQATGPGGEALVSEDAGSAARPESGGSAGRPTQESRAGPQPSRMSATGGSRDEVRPESGGSVAPQSSMAESAGGESAQAGAVACPAPYLEAKPARAAPGASFRLRGGNFSSGCDKIKIKGARGIRLAFRQGGRTWKLATVDADRSLTFEIGLRVPAGAGPGRATVRATTRSGEPVEERFLVL